MTFFKFIEIVQLRNVIIYIVAINIIGFFAMFFDKQKAKRGSWRTPEKTLFIITLLRWRNRNNYWNVFI